jgi:hypothetical protein
MHWASLGRVAADRICQGNPQSRQLSRLSHLVQPDFVVGSGP